MKFSNLIEQIVCLVLEKQKMIYLKTNFHHPYKMTSSGLEKSIVLCNITCPSWHCCRFVYLMFLFVVDLELCSAEQDPIQYMWQAIFSYVPFKGRIVGSYANWFFDGLGKISLLPSHNVDVCH